MRKLGLNINEAEKELIKTIDFYENKLSGLGLDFEKPFSDSLQQIQKNPDFRKKFKNGTQKYFMERFPFAIVYLNLSDYIWIVAVAHGKRKPNFWNKRI